MPPWAIPRVRSAQFVVDRARAKGWGSGSGAVAGIEPSFDPALAVGEAAVEGGMHSKSLRAMGLKWR